MLSEWFWCLQNCGGVERTVVFKMVWELKFPNGPEIEVCGMTERD